MTREAQMKQKIAVVRMRAEIADKAMEIFHEFENTVQFHLGYHSIDGEAPSIDDAYNYKHYKAAEFMRGWLDSFDDALEAYLEEGV